MTKESTSIAQRLDTCAAIVNDIYNDTIDNAPLNRRVESLKLDIQSLRSTMEPDPNQMSLF